jgi:long-subunit fatty acid transport protein
MRKLVLVAALSVATTSVFAQTKNFEGFFIEGGLALGSSSFRNSVVDSGDTPSSSTDEFGGKSFSQGKVSLGYMKAIDNKFMIGLSVSSLLGTSTVANNASSNGETDTAKFKNNYSIALIPAYAVSDQFAVRGKISYNSVKFESSGLNSDENNLVPNTSSAKFNGIGLGIGAQYYFTKNIYAAIDVERVMYSSKKLDLTYNGNVVDNSTFSVTTKPSTTIGLISIGYKF